MGTGQMQPQGSSLFEAPATGDASSLTHEGVSGSFNSSPRPLTPPSQGPARTSQGGQDRPHLSGCLAGQAESTVVVPHQASGCFARDKASVEPGFSPVYLKQPRSLLHTHPGVHSPRDVDPVAPRGRPASLWPSSELALGRDTCLRDWQRASHSSWVLFKGGYKKKA